ncbi:MAG: AEC family transporter [Clostridiales bacterium]|jgi:predicted permease|nr:AEC family transporter [Clostridiales bacterium]
MNISEIISQMAVLFIILAIGYCLNKLKILDSNSNKLLTKLVLNIAMPCTIIYSVLSRKNGVSGRDTAFFMLMILLTFAIAFVLVIPLPRLLRNQKEDSGLYRYLTVFGNVGFMGFPVAMSVFGEESAFYVALFNIPFSLLAFSVGIMMISGSGGEINPRLFINPSLIASVLAILIFFFKIPIPVIITKTAGQLGQLTTPVAMLVIGSTLAAIPPSEVFRQWRLYPVSFVKLIVVPLITWLVLRILIDDPLMLGVLVVLAGMPTATSATMICMEYGGNEKLASKGVFITTLFSMITIPLLVIMLFA